MKRNQRNFMHVVVIFITFIPLSWCNAQVILDWQKCFGGTQSDIAFSIQQTSDGGYIALGESQSSDGDITQHIGNRDGWLIKMDSLSNLQWQVSLGGTNLEFAYKVLQTQDNGYLVGGYSYSSMCSGANSNMWFLKTDSIGNMLWEQCYGGNNYEGLYSFQQTTDGGFILIGTSGGPLPGDADVMLVKCDSIGNFLWSQYYGGSSDDYGMDIVQTEDNGFMILANTASQDGDVTTQHGNQDFWLIKTDSVGNIQYNKCLGGSRPELPRSFYRTSDGGYVITGSSRSLDGDVSGNYNPNGNYADVWVVRIDSLINIMWEQNFGGYSIDIGNSIYPVNNGGSIIVGNTFSNSGNVSGNHGSHDIWLFKIDDFGNLIWEQCFGGSMDEKGYAVVQDANGNYVVAGSTTSNDYDVSGLHSANTNDYWIIKVNDQYSTELNEFQNIDNHFDIYPNPTTEEVTFTLKNLRGKNVTIEMYNIYGQLLSVFDEETISSDLKYIKKDLNNIPSGIYMVNFRCSSGMYTKRMVKL